MTIGEQITKYKRKRSVTLRTLSEKTGISRDNIHHYQCNRGLGVLKKLETIADALDCDLVIEFRERSDI